MLFKSAQTIETWKHCTSKLLGFIINLSTGTSNLIVINVSTKHQPNVIWECTHYRNMRGSYLIVINVYTKQLKRVLWATKNQNMKESSLGIKSSKYKATIKSHLRVHVCTIEEWGDQIWLWSMWVQSKTKKSTNSAQAMETWFDCDQSEYKANHKDSLRLHKQSKHEGSKYDQCEYKATTKSNLRVHTLSKQAGIKFDCEQCEYKATKKAI